MRNKSPLVGALISIGLSLLAIVDFRRGFLFPSYWYKSPFYFFNPLQIVIFVCGVAGVLALHKRLAKPDRRSENFLLIGIFTLLLIDAGLYRGVAADRALIAGKIGTDWLQGFGAVGAWKPFGLTLSYVLTVWHATILGCLGAGLAMLALPRILNVFVARGGWRSSVAGTAYAFTQPFCSCCAAMTAPGLFRANWPVNFALAVFLGAPLLNISTLILAGSLLPWPYACLRILGGIVITFAISFALSKWLKLESQADPDWNKSIREDSPENVIASWLKLSARVALILVPSMILGTVLSSLVWNLWPTSFGNSLTSVVLTSILGSLVMVSTWSEIPLAGQMIQQGMTGPAAAALIALPAVNLGSLLIVGQVTRNWKMVAMLGVSVIAVSILVGAVFI